MAEVFQLRSEIPPTRLVDHSYSAYSAYNGRRGSQSANRGRERRLVSAPPPSEPDWRFSRIRLSSWWFTSFEDCVLSQRLLRVLATPARQSMHLARVCGPASSSLVLCDVVVSAE